MKGRNLVCIIWMLVRIALLVLLVVALVESLSADETAAGAAEAAGTGAPVIFTDVSAAKSHAKDSGKLLVIACLSPSDEASSNLGKLLETNEVYLDGETAVVLKYLAPDENRVKSFRDYFKVTKPGFPILVVSDSQGQPLASETGISDQEQCLAFLEKTIPSALALPKALVLKRKISAALAAENERKGSKYHTDFREWTLITGEKITGAVVASTGQTVTFKTEDGEYREVPAGRLVRRDIEFLQQTIKPADVFP